MKKVRLLEPDLEIHFFLTPCSDVLARDQERCLEGKQQVSRSQSDEVLSIKPERSLEGNQ